MVNGLNIEDYPRRCINYLTTLLFKQMNFCVLRNKTPGVLEILFPVVSCLLRHLGRVLG